MWVFILLVIFEFMWCIDWREISLGIYYIIIGGLCYKYDCFVRGVSKKYDDFWL